MKLLSLGARINHNVRRTRMLQPLSYCPPIKNYSISAIEPRQCGWSGFQLACDVVTTWDKVFYPSFSSSNHSVISCVQWLAVLLEATTPVRTEKLSRWKWLIKIFLYWFADRTQIMPAKCPSQHKKATGFHHGESPAFRPAFVLLYICWE